MTTPESKQTDSSYKTRLYPDDQAKVDEFVSSGINSVERKPFRPGRLLVLLVVVVVSLSVFSQYMASLIGIY